MKKFTVGGTFGHPTETIYLRTINAHEDRKVRFPLPEVAVLLLIMQIRQALPKNKISSITLKLIVIDTFKWSPFPSISYREGHGAMVRARISVNVAACRAVSNPAWCRIFRETSCFSPLNIGTLLRCCVVGQGT